MTKSKRPGVTGLGRVLLVSSWLVLIVLLMAWLAPALAHAQDAVSTTAVTTTAVPQTSLDRLSTQVMDILVPVFVALIGALGTWVLNKVRQKTHIQVSDQTIDAWSTVARKAALRGAEWARNEVKKRTEGEKIPGPEVLDMAANWAIDLADSMKLPELGRKKLEGLIEAHLHELRLEVQAPMATPDPVTI